MAEKLAIPEGADTTAAINRHLFDRRMRTNRRFMKWGLGAALLGGGLFLAGTLLAPIIPVTAVSIAALHVANILGKVAITTGIASVAFGAGKQFVDTHRKV